MKRGYSGADTLGEREVRAPTAQTLELESAVSASGWAIPVCGTCLGRHPQRRHASMHVRSFICDYNWNNKSRVERTPLNKWERDRWTERLISPAGVPSVASIDIRYSEKHGPQRKSLDKQSSRDPFSFCKFCMRSSVSILARRLPSVCVCLFWTKTPRPPQDRWRYLGKTTVRSSMRIICNVVAAEDEKKW